jgi:hypothetical protein
MDTHYLRVTEGQNDSKERRQKSTRSQDIVESLLTAMLRPDEAADAHSYGSCGCISAVNCCIEVLPRSGIKVDPRQRLDTTHSSYIDIV